MLPWFQQSFPLYLAPMAGVTDSVFRQLCKEYGADVLVTEFVSAEGVFRRNERTLEYLEFVEAERPLGIQLFGADPDHLGEAARKIVEWKNPDFIDLNFGCPVNKVVSKNGGSALLRDCPLLEKVARGVVQAVAPFPVTAKMRIGWSRETVNATTTARILEDAGVRALAVHGRTKDQGYTALFGRAMAAYRAALPSGCRRPGRRAPLHGGDAEPAHGVLPRNAGRQGVAGPVFPRGQHRGTRGDRG